MPPLISAWCAIAVPPRLNRRSTFSALPLDHLREDLPEHDLLGEVLRADDDVAPVRRVRRPTAPRAVDTDQDHGNATTRRSVDRRRGSAMPAGQRERGVAGEREQRRRNRAGEDHRGVDHREAAEDVVAKPARADRRRDRGRADADHDGDAQAGHDRRQRQRPLDLREHLPRRQSHRHRALDHRRRHALNARDRSAQDGQDRIDRQRHERRARADAADERQRDQESEQGQARDRLRQVGERDDRLGDRRPPRRQDAERDADRRRDRGRDEHQHDVLAEPRDEFSAMRRR